MSKTKKKHAKKELKPVPNYKKVQAKFPLPLVDSIERLPGFKSMNSFLRSLAEEKVTT